jgi:hypothetical protein
MKKITIIGTLLICMNASAMTLNHARVVSVREWTTGGATGHYTETNTRGSSSATARVTSAEGYPNSNTYVYGQHSYSVSNTTPYLARYEFHYRLCADSVQCFNRIENIEVDPKGTASGSGTSTLACYFANSGKYQSSAYTEISGEYTTSETDYGTIDIRHR